MRPLGASDPTAVGPYRLLGILGRGGMGRVYLGESRTGRRVAIKVLRAELVEDAGSRRRFEREVAAARTVSPLYTAAVVDADTAADSPWLATTYIDGPNLSDFVSERGPLAPGAVLTLAAGLAEALASIHEAGLVHRDLKPGNVLLDNWGPHIIDFGIALSPDVTRMTASLMMGTPSYIAPEVIQGEEPGPASDMFALGATLVFAASGVHLVKEGPMHAQMLQIAAGRFDLGGVAKELRPLIVRCTSSRPQERPTADELARILVGSGVSKPAPGWFSSSAPAPTVQLPPLASARLSRRRLLVIGGGGISVLAVGGAAAAWAGLFARGTAPLTAPSSLATPTPSTTAAPTAVASSPPNGSGPGSLVWQARSGAVPVSGSRSIAQSPDRIVVDGAERLIVANGSQVTATGIDGVVRWTRELPTGLVNLWPWGEDLLITDARRLWLLEARTGRQRFTLDVAAREEAAAAGDNPDNHPIQLGGVAVSSDTAYVGLGTASVALDRTGRQLWRRARPDSRNGVRPPAGVPVATRGQWLVTHDPSGAVVDLGLRDVKDGRLRWLVQYEPASTTPGGPPPGPPAPGGESGPPPTDAAWSRSEGRIGQAHVVIREVQEVRAVALTNGSTTWRQVSQTPIAGMELVGDTVLVAADRLRAYAVASGAQLWDAELRGARVAITPDGRTIVAAGDQGIAALDPSGRVLWLRPYPEALGDAIADRVRVQGDVAVVTFRPKGEQRDPLAIDVIAVRLGPDA